MPTTALHPLTGQRIKSRVAYNPTYGEYAVRVYDSAGNRYPDGDYYTTDRDDAHDTLATMIREGEAY